MKKTCCLPFVKCCVPLKARSFSQRAQGVERVSYVAGENPLGTIFGMARNSDFSIFQGLLGCSLGRVLTQFSIHSEHLTFS